MPPRSGSPWKRALSAAALACCIAVIFGAFVLGAKREHEDDVSAASKRAGRIAVLAASDAYPITEAASLATCGRRSLNVGPCVLAEETMREKGGEPWRLASPERRQACLADVLDGWEPAARLFVCLKR